MFIFVIINGIWDQQCKLCYSLNCPVSNCLKSINFNRLVIIILQRKTKTNFFDELTSGRICEKYKEMRKIFVETTLNWTDKFKRYYFKIEEKILLNNSIWSYNIYNNIDWNTILIIDVYSFLWHYRMCYCQNNVFINDYLPIFTISRNK